MLEKYFQLPFTRKQLRNGPSGPWIEGFARFLHDNGNSWWTARTYLRAAHHLGHFLNKTDIELAAVKRSYREN
jgi:hypothetical protein